MPNDTMKQINCFANDIAAGKTKTDDDVRALLDAVRSALNVDVIFVLQNIGLKYDF